MTTGTRDRRIDPALRRLVWILVLGALAPMLDTTIVNVALATVGRALHAPLATSQWTITGYLLAMGMAMPVTGWATGRFGAKRVWLFALGLFLGGSLLSGAAWNVPGLIVFRLVQGAAAGLILPVVTTVLVRAAGPNRLGRVMAVATLPVVVVPVFGPVIGGLIVNNLSWRSIFFVNVPICLAALLLAWRAMPADARARTAHPLDVPGLALLPPGLALIIYGLSRVTAGGFTSSRVAVPVTGGLALTAAFVVHALRRRARPLINLRVFRVRSYTASAGVLFLAGLSLYGPMLLLALYYQQVEHRDAVLTGLLLAPQGIGSLLPRTVAGRLADRIGPRPIVLTGMALTSLGTLPFAVAGPHTGWLLAASLFVRGAGLAAATIAVMAGAFQGVPPDEVPDASATTRIVQQVGGSFGAAVLAVILAHGLAADGSTAAFHAAFGWAIGFGVLAVLPALSLPGAAAGRAATREPGRTPSLR